MSKAPNPIVPNPTPVKTVADLERRLGANWPAIDQAQETTDKLRERLTQELKKFEDPSCAIIVTGSLGRGEASEASDADWYLLVDGPSTPDHARFARDISTIVRDAGFKDVGSTGMFGDIVASHDLVHHIAGMRDTNANLTRRLLLLAESHALCGAVVRERVIGNVLARYVTYDRAVQSNGASFSTIPHFLLNDVVRFWRTMASDYASKKWERDGQGWATRNIKLRFSRKLLFTWGLLASFAGELFPTEQLKNAAHDKDEDAFVLLLADLIRGQTSVTPLDLLARAASKEGVKAATASRIFSAYNTFLENLSDEKTRKHLDDLPFAEAGTDDVYKCLHSASHEFRDGMRDLFFDEHPRLKRLIRDYGVF